MTDPGFNPSFTELLSSLATDIPDLFQKEIRLAKAEARDALELLIAAVQRLALGSAFAVGAIGVLLAAIVSGLTALFVARGMELALASTLAASIVTVVAAIIAWLFFASAMRSLRSAKASLDGTVGVIASSAANVAEKF